jgi:hypothetical protein
MSTLDIREDTRPTTQIRFAAADTNRYVADVLTPNTYGPGIEIKDSDMDRSLEVRDALHARNLIKALEKAIQLGWMK